MPLESQYFSPFDEIYRAVTERMRSRSQQLAVDSERNWLNHIIGDFQNERNVWLVSPSLEAYRLQCERLRFRVVRLVASAFLHVSYDLPRVLADNWPAQGQWHAGPSEPRGERLYFDLRSIFSDVLSTRARRPQVTGVFAPILWCVPLKLIGNLVHWISHLREAAWRHGRTLSNLAPINRADTEQRMLQAMSIALREVNNLPWTFTLPEPPNVVAGSLAIVPAFLIAPDNLAVIVLIGSLISLCAAAYLSWTALKTDEISRFVDEFGSRVERYMDLAINHPDTFADMKDSSERLV